MIKFKITRKGKNLLKEIHKDIRRRYKIGFSIEDIAKTYSLETEYVNIIVSSKNDKSLPEYNEWKFNYLTMLWKNNIDIETIKKLCPINEEYFSHDMLGWEVLNMSKYKNFEEYWMNVRREEYDC